MPSPVNSGLLVHLAYQAREEYIMVRLRVKEILKQRKISMGKLSRMSDVSFTTIRRICNDLSYSPTFNTLVSIAKALAVKVDDLYEHVPDDPTYRKPLRAPGSDL